MGVVYRALDTTLQRPAALKVIEQRQSSDDAARARLLREARLASSLNHPNICTVYEVNDLPGAIREYEWLLEQDPKKPRRSRGYGLPERRGSEPRQKILNLIRSRRKVTHLEAH